MSHNKEDFESKKLKPFISFGNFVAVAAVVFLIGFVAGTRKDMIFNFFTTGKTYSTAELDLSSVNDVYNTLRLNFDGSLDKNKLINGAKRGLVEAAGDRYTTFMDEQEATEFRKSLEGDVGAGIGVEIGERNGYVVVIRALKNNPAIKAGLRSGDIFYKVNGEDVSQMTSEEVANKVRGTAGTSVKIVVVRDGEEKEFNITREKINNPSVELDYEGDVAILKLSRFDNDTSTLAKKAAQEINEKNISKVILDLRSNGGGYVTAAQGVLGLWLDNKVVLIEKVSSGSSTEIKSTSGDAILAGKKTVVLVDGYSASASEIVVGALKDYQMATVVGETTFGKGSVQSVLDLDAGGILKVTIAKWYTPHNLNINNNGIKPDIEVVLTPEDINNDNDRQLKAALDTIRR
jgi:C-terminal peptidase (prc)